MRMGRGEAGGEEHHPCSVSPGRYSPRSPLMSGSPEGGAVGEGVKWSCRSVKISAEMSKMECGRKKKSGREEKEWERGKMYARTKSSMEDD